MFCPKCGNDLPDGATFCGKCGHQLAQTSPAVTPQVRSASKPAASAILGSAGSYMPLVRIALGIVLLLLAFAPLVEEAYTYTGMVTGSSSNSTAYNLFAVGDSQATAMYIAAIVLVIAGAVLEKVKNLSAGRWISFVGFLFFIGCVALLFVAFSVANPNEYANAYVAQASHTYSIAWGCWAIAILGVIGAVSCFIKKA